MIEGIKNTDLIDVVYTWVDGNEPRWKQKKEKAQKALNQKLSTNSSSKTRFVDNNELLFSLRSIDLYMPWVHHIYIITDNQVPEWLKMNKKVTIVDHSDIMAKYINLPVFNSVLIEWFLAEIPGLSEKFIYFNDDVMVGSSLEPSDFFDSKGRPIYRTTGNASIAKQKKGVIKNLESYLKKGGANTAWPFIENSFVAVECELNQRLERYFLQHTPHPILKSRLIEERIKYQKYIKDMSKNKFRSSVDLWVIMIMAVKDIYRDDAIRDVIKEEFFEFVTNQDYPQPNSDLLKIFKNSTKFISIATGDTIDPFRMKAANAVLSIKFNNPSRFEKPNIIKNNFSEELKIIIQNYLNPDVNSDNFIKDDPIESITVINNKNNSIIGKYKYNLEVLSTESMKNRMKTYAKYIFTYAPSSFKRIKGQNNVEHNLKLIQRSRYFDHDFYLNNYTDVKKAGINPLEHYLTYGGFEGRNPSERFNSELYILNNPEVLIERVNPLIHYLTVYKDTSAKFTGNEFDLYRKRQYEKEVYDGILDSANHAEKLVAIFSMQWEGVLQQRPHHIARLLASPDTLVVYVDNHITLPRKLSDNLFLIPGSNFIRKLSNLHTVTNKFFWLFSTTMIPFQKIEALSKSGYKIAYDYIDDINESITMDIKYPKENYKRLKTINPVLLLASAKNLQHQLEKKFPGRNVLLCPNAVDISHFDYHLYDKLKEVPEDMKPIVDARRPIVGYYGAIAPWLDYDLINKITEERDDLSFVFIGLNYNGALENLAIKDNVYFLGSKNYIDLPSYSYWFDCAIIPFQNGEVAKSTSPIKLYEYMAMGLPTVCTKDLKECAGYKYVYISKNYNEFVRNIDTGIRDKHNKVTREALIQQALKNTWQARVLQIDKELTKIIRLK